MLEIDEQEFEEMVVAAYDAVPAGVKERIAHVALLLADDVSDEQRKELGLSEDDDLLGLFEGLTRGEESDAPSHLPPTITLFRWPLLDACDTREQLEQEIKDTLWHEVAHYLGMDETDVRHEEAKTENEPR